MKTFFKILLFLLGFPALIVAVFFASTSVLEAGESYFPWVYGGLGVTILVTVLFLITTLITGSISKRSGKVKIIRRCTAALVLIGVILSTGVWIGVDTILPTILEDATSGTIKYDEYRHDYEARAIFHGEMLENFIEWNIENGNLVDKTPEEYYAEGWRNQEIKDLISSSYESINDGYNSFVGPWLPLADGSRLTIPVLVHLILNEREQSLNPFLYYGEGREEAGKENDPINWTILDMQEGKMTIDISGLFENETVSFILSMITGQELDNLLESLYTVLDSATGDDRLAGAPIYIRIDLKNGELIIAPTGQGATPDGVVGRGVWDYKHQAWFNSNELLFLVISLLPARNLFLIFGGIIAIFSIMVGMIRESQYGKKRVASQAVVTQMNQKQTGNAASHQDTGVSPYMQYYMSAMNESDSRLRRR